MIVQELFQQADSGRVEEAYFLMHTIFYPYEKFSLDKKIDATIRIKGYIREYISRFSACDINIKEPQTIFIIELPCENYEDKGDTELTLFLVDDSEARRKVQGDFSAWSGDEEHRINHYGISMSRMEEIAGCHIAGESVENLGITACCAKILYEFFEFGYSDESREKNIQDLYERLEEGKKDIEEGRTFSHEEVFSHLWQEMLEACTDEDERTHMILKKEYEDKVEEIERRYVYKVLEENHKKVIDLIKKEYFSRSSG
ncbi:MAG: hypothetical protein LUG93_13285 [Lachnospiraceae bacterium]|nr:hypothetical protein [Lachnospiraceae bacterium]